MAEGDNWSILFDEEIVYVQGVRANEWFLAFEWQKKLYRETRNLGGQGGALYLNDATKEIEHNGFRYRVYVKAGFEKVVLRNMDTGTERQMCSLPIHDGAKRSKHPTITIHENQ